MGLFKKKNIQDKLKTTKELEKEAKKIQEMLEKQKKIEEEQKLKKKRQEQVTKTEEVEDFEEEDFEEEENNFFDEFTNKIYKVAEDNNTETAINLIDQIKNQLQVKMIIEMNEQSYGDNLEETENANEESEIFEK